jgi:hypothetical protein
MCSKSFLMRWEMYFKAKDAVSRQEKAELPLNPKHEGSEIDSPVVGGAEMKEASPEPGMAKPIHLST